MKKVLFFLFSLVLTVQAANVKIDNYPTTTTLADNDLLFTTYWNGVRYSTNKNISFTNFVTQLGTLIGGSAGKLSIASNLLDVASITASRSNLVAETRRVINVRDYLAAGEATDGSTDNTTAVTAAYNALNSTNGGVLYMGDGDWKFNLTVTKPNVTIQGNSHMIDFVGTMKNRFVPANNSLPIIQVGNDSGYVKGFVLKDATLDGQNLGAIGLYMAGGAFAARVQNCALVYATNCIKILGGTTYPASLIWFDHVDVQPPNLTGARGFNILQTANYPTSYTTAIFINNSHGSGPSAATSDGYAFETDSVGVYLANTYFDTHDDHSFKISKTKSPVPYLYCSNLAIDSSPGTSAALESYSNNRYFADQISGQFSIAGKWKLLDGTPITPPQGVLRQNASLLYPQVQGTLNFTELNDGTFTGDNYTNHQIYPSGGNFWIKSAGTIKVDSAAGAFQIDGENASGAGYLKLADNVNSKTVIIQGLNGSINLRAVAGGAIRFQDTLGNNRAQINANGGFFLTGQTAGSSTTAGPLLFMDSNEQVKTTTALSISGTNTTVNGVITFPDGVKQTFNPNATTAGINVGSQAGDPSSLANGDLWYDSTGNALKARINGSSISLGAGGGGSAPVGTMVSDVTGFATGAIPKSKDATGTNFTGSGMIITSTNLSIPGTLTVDNIVATNGIVIGGGSTNLSITGNITANAITATNGVTVSDVAASSLLRTDSNKKIAAVTIGSNLSFDGTTLSATGGSSGSTDVTTSGQNVNNSTALVDSGLQIAISANTKYRFEATAWWNVGGVTGVPKIAITAPASPNSIRYFIVGSTSGGFDASNVATTAGQELTLNTGSGQKSFRIIGFIDNGANAGNLTVQFAQQAAEAVNTTMEAGSYMIVNSL